MKNLLLLCAGSHGLNALEILRGQPAVHLLGCLDDRHPHIMEPPSLGPLSLMAAMLQQAQAAYVGLGNILYLKERRKIFLEAQRLDYEMIDAIHSQAYRSPTSICGNGLFMGPFSVIHARAQVGHNVCIYSGSVVEHDCHLSNHVFLGPGVHMGGWTCVDEGAYISLGARVASGVRVGAHSLVAAGAVVLHDVAPDTLVRGVPARPCGSVSEWVARKKLEET
ncbi:acetyltransferase [bacterium]|nr:acetyltransferase [bacterium]